MSAVITDARRQALSTKRRTVFICDVVLPRGGCQSAPQRAGPDQKHNSRRPGIFCGTLFPSFDGTLSGSDPWDIYTKEKEEAFFGMGIRLAQEIRQFKVQEDF